MNANFNHIRRASSSPTRARSTLGAPSPSSAKPRALGRAGPGAVAVPRRVAEAATMTAGAGTHRERRRYRMRRSGGRSRMHFPA
jgi:hypothetical protein